MTTLSMLNPVAIGTTLSFGHVPPPDFYGLAGPVLWALRAADIGVERVDLGLTGDGISIRTPLADVRLSRTGTDVSVHVIPRAGRPCERARQICYRLTRRLSELHPEATVLWHTARERLDPSAFGVRVIPVATARAV